MLDFTETIDTFVASILAAVSDLLNSIFGALATFFANFNVTL